MPAEISQILALITHGNAYLAGDESVLEQFKNHPTLQFCREISFVGLDMSGEPSVVYEGIQKWFAYLKQDGVTKLTYNHIGKERSEWVGINGEKSYMSPRMTAGFVGGNGENSIMTWYKDGGVKWKVGYFHNEEAKKVEETWDVVYASQPIKELNKPEDIDLSKTKKRLEDALNKVLALCEKEGEDLFRKRFVNAKQALTTEVFSSENSIFNLKIYPKGDNSPLEQKQLIEAACQAFVFGGMGSWNDIGVEDAHAKEYNEVSDELYDCLWPAFLAINT